MKRLLTILLFFCPVLLFGQINHIEKMYGISINGYIVIADHEMASRHISVYENKENTINIKIRSVIEFYQTDSREYTRVNVKREDHQTSFYIKNIKTFQDTLGNTCFYAIVADGNGDYITWSDIFMRYYNVRKNASVVYENNK